MKKYAMLCFVFLTLISSFLSVNALAQSAEDSSLNTSQTNVGRLFYSPHQRQQLDANRPSRAPRQTQQQLVTRQKIPPPTRTEPVTLNGYVQRSDGKSTVWVNQQPIQENAMLDDVQIGKLNHQLEKQKGHRSVTQTEKLNIRIPANGQHIQLKAGQQFDPKNNQVKEITTVAKEKQLLSESADEMTEIE